MLHDISVNSDLLHKGLGYAWLRWDHPELSFGDYWVLIQDTGKYFLLETNIILSASMHLHARIDLIYYDWGASGLG